MQTLRIVVKKWWTSEPGDGCVDYCDSLTQHIMHGDDERKAYLASPEGKTDKKKLAPFRVWCVVELAAATNMLPPVPVIN